MVFSTPDTQRQANLASRVFMLVLILHIGVVWTLSALPPTSHAPSASISILETFVMTNVSDHAVRQPSNEQAPVPEAFKDAQPIPATQEAIFEQETTTIEQPAFQSTQPVVPKPLPPLPQPRQPIPQHKLSTSTAETISQTQSKSQSQSQSQSTSAHHNITLPITDAKYLNNPHPAYPRQSRRSGEQGMVVIAVQIDIDGTALQARILRSSGHARLDDSARKTILNWRFVPGKKAGVPQKMWANIPINFVLE